MPPDPQRIQAAYEKVCRVLLEHQNSDGYWTGMLSASALSTATAVSAFSVFSHTLHHGDGAKHHLTADEFQQLENLIDQSTQWLAAHQNPDGGWGDTNKSLSNISTTLLVKSAIVLAERVGSRGDTLSQAAAAACVSSSTGDHPCSSEGGEPNQFPSMEGTGGGSLPFNDKGTTPASPQEGNDKERTNEYLRGAGGFDAIKKRYGNDQTFSVPILTNAALAGLVEWSEIPQLPFELAALPMSWFRFVKMNVVSYAVPALVAIGQVRFHFLQGKGRPITNYFRRKAKKRTLQLIQDMQPVSGGYLEAAPLTAFVVMSLSAMGLTDHPIVTKGLRFLLQTVRDDGSWAIDTNLATWLTSLSLNALQDSGCVPSKETIDWLLSCQHKCRHPFTGAQPGGWGWTNLSGAVPDADDTSAALLALSASHVENEHAPEVLAGIEWLLDLQNRNGGMPTFCRGWGMLPFDQSSADITAHALRALRALRDMPTLPPKLLRKMQRAEARMVAFLEKTRQKDKSWLPLWFGNQFMPEDANPIYGTARVLITLMEGINSAPEEESMMDEGTLAISGSTFLFEHQNADGGWGHVPVADGTGRFQSGGSSVEETAVVLEALIMVIPYLELMLPSATINDMCTYYHRGLNWLLDAVESDRFLEPSPIGLYFAKLWYHERLYPIIFTASALRRAIASFAIR